MTGIVELYTDIPVITFDNVVDVLKTAYAEYAQTVNRIEYLFKYEAGNQPLLRKKTYRSDIDIKCVDNLANEIVDFKTGFIWGNPITFIQSGKEEDFGEDVLKAVAEINRCYESQFIKKKTQHLARNVEVCGIGYTFVDINTDMFEDGDSYFEIESLDPRSAFVVRSSYYTDKRPMLGVIIRENKKNDKTNAEFGEIVNTGIHNTLGRSINTTLTTLFTIGMIYILGVDSIKDFAFPLIVGIIAGLFSSVFVSGMLWDMLVKVLPKKKAKKAKIKK